MDGGLTKGSRDGRGLFRSYLERSAAFGHDDGSGRRSGPFPCPPARACAWGVVGVGWWCVVRHIRGRLEVRHQRFGEAATCKGKRSATDEGKGHIHTHNKLTLLHHHRRGKQELHPRQAKLVSSNKEQRGRRSAVSSNN